MPKGVLAQCAGDSPRHSSILGTLPLTEAPVPADLPRRIQLTGSRSRVHGHGLADDEAIADELADGLAGVGAGDFGDFTGVEPDLALAAADDRGSEPSLGAEVDPVD